MEKNIFLEIEYVGVNYFGFQIQPREHNQPTIQSVLESALAKLFKQKIRIIASGRTDRGVHAVCHPVNFKVNTNIPLKRVKRALNSFLPSDIRIKKIKKVPLDFQARFCAHSKIYRYIILNQKDPSVFWSSFSWHVPENINISLMRRISKEIIGKRDFSFFAKGSKGYNSCVRNLKKITIKKRSNLVYVELEADGFLRQMARSIVFFLVQAQADKISRKDIEAILAGRKRYLKKPAPPQGLYLRRVKY